MALGMRREFLRSARAMAQNDFPLLSLFAPKMSLLRGTTTLLNSRSLLQSQSMKLETSILEVGLGFVLNFRPMLLHILDAINPPVYFYSFFIF